MPDIKCIAGFYDASIQSRGCKYVVYTDLSSWDDLPGTYVLEVRPPGSSDYDFLIEVDAAKANKLTPDQLGVGPKEGNLVDGIYCFRVNNCGSNYFKTFPILCNLYCMFDSMLATAKYDHEFDRLKDIEYYIKSIEENSIRNKTEKAQFFYKKAYDLIGCKNCKCPN